MKHRPGVKTMISMLRRSIDPSGAAWTGLISAGVLIGVFGAAPAAPGPDAALDETGRLVHHFDFDERSEGNLEPIPKFWLRFGGESFPHYVNATFDSAIGHDAPPSFRLVSEGRNVAFRYAGGKTRIELHNDYLIVAWIRADQLLNARAAISAYYLDHDALPIVTTHQFSELVGGDTGDETWHRVEVFLPQGPRTAKTIGLTAWVVQEEIWNQSPKPLRYVWRRDVRAAAWFDDVRVYRLPRVSLATSAPGNVIIDADNEEGAALRVRVTDDDETLSAELTIFDIDGQPIRRADIPIHVDDSQPAVEVDVSGLDNGLYRARLDVYSEGRLLVSRERQFASVGKALADAPVADRPVTLAGVVLDAADQGDPIVELALLQVLNVGVVKIPVWSGRADAPDLADGSDATGVMMFELVKAGVALTAVFSGPPSDLMKEAGAYPRPLLELLNEDPATWREQLARVAVPYSNMFRSWQVGPDGEETIVTDERLTRALEQVQREMVSLNTGTSLSIPGSLTLSPTPPPPQVDDACLKIDHTISPDFIASHLQAYRDAAYPATSVFIQPTPPSKTDRVSRLRDWSRRLVHTLHAGPGTAFVPQPWHTYLTYSGIVTEPDEEFVLLYTVIRLLSETTPGPVIQIAPDVTCLSFESGEKTVLALWDDRASPEGRLHSIQLGEATTQYDMWGRSVPLEKGPDGRHLMRLFREPTFIGNVDRWLLMFRTQMTLDPNQVEVSIASHKHTLKIVNTHAESLSGRIRLTPPESWDVTPNEFTFSLLPDGTLEKSIQIRYGRNETAGAKTILAEVDLNSEGRYRMVVPLALELGLEGIDAWGYAVVEGDRILVRHGITNRTTETLSFRSFAIAPGRPRQHRLINELLPGQTRTVEYRFRDASKFHGRTIRLHLRELGGPRIHNVEVDVD